ncbi:MAG: DEAD/DEAH box helicase [Candidatus Lokiarchaeota archaeon]|nr:DEAD/DEAH box helicase [Candidatus Lokiarchaeota archaeon]
MKEITPRDYQINARDQAIAKINSEKNVILILLPTGMGKTLISCLIIDQLIDSGEIASDEKVLYLVGDRKLKHQLFDMGQEYGLGKHGNLFLLPERGEMPARMVRNHAKISKIIYATPILLLNSLIAKSRRTQMIEKETIKNVKLIVIDEILDIMAQSYGKRRTKEETIKFIETNFQKSFDEIVGDLIAQYPEVRKNDIEGFLLNEFSAKYWRLNKRFEPLLNYLKVFNKDSEKIIVGLTASISQKKKRDLLIKTFGEERSVEVFPEGEDFESYRPKIQLKRIQVFDDWVIDLDSKIKEIKMINLKNINKAYKALLNRSKLPSDRILLFISDILGKNKIQNKLKEKRGEDFLNKVMTHASSYLIATVARQKLLENTFASFVRFIKRTKNSFLQKNENFQYIKDKVEERIQEIKEDGGPYISKKEERLLFWLKRFVEEGKKVLVLCRFVKMTQYLYNIMEHERIKSTYVHGKMSGNTQHRHIMEFKRGEAMILFASERLIERGTDLPEADVAIYYGTTVSLERYEQSLGRIRSNYQNIKTAYTITYNQTTENEKSLKRDLAFLEIFDANKLIKER